MNRDDSEYLNFHYFAKKLKTLVAAFIAHQWEQQIVSSEI